MCCTFVDLKDVLNSKNGRHQLERQTGRRLVRNDIFRVVDGGSVEKQKI